MSRVAYCSKCFRIVLADEVTGFDTCPKCREKYIFTEINQHSWYLMSAEQRKEYKSQWFGTDHASAHDTVKSFNQETGQEFSSNPVQNAPEAHVSQNAQPSQDENNDTDNFPVTTGETFENKKIRKYLGVVSGTQVISASAISNIDRARNHSMDDMISKCSELGGNAAIGVSIETTMSADYVVLTTVGTAVLI